MRYKNPPSLECVKARLVTGVAKSLAALAKSLAAPAQMVDVKQHTGTIILYFFINNKPPQGTYDFCVDGISIQQLSKLLRE